MARRLGMHWHGLVRIVVPLVGAAVLTGACGSYPTSPPAVGAVISPSPFVSPSAPQATQTQETQATATPVLPATATPAPKADGGLIGAHTDPDLALAMCDELRRDRVAATPLWVRWGDVDLGGGRYNWQDLDSQVDTLRGCGLEVALHVQARQGRLRPSKLPANTDDYRRFLTDLVAHLKGRVRRYSIENEAVLGPIMWADSPEDYFQLLDLAYATIKSADPGAVVLESGLASPALAAAVAHSLYNSGQRESALALYRDMFADLVPALPHPLPQTEADLEAAFRLPMTQRALGWMPLMVQHQGSYDALQVHFYGPWQDLPVIVQWLKAQGIDKPFEVWELAKYTPAGAALDETSHAQETARLLVTAAGEGARLTVFTRYLDWPLFRLPGLITKRGPRPAQTAFRVVAQNLNGFRTAEQVDLGPSVRAYHFTRPQGELYVLWTTGGQATVELPLDGPTATVTDIQAQALQADPASLSVGPSPLFVTP